MSKEKVAKVLFDTGAVEINIDNPFTFASGIKSPIYCDNRKILGFAKERDIIIESFLEILPNDIDIIVGVATAGIPWASFLSDRIKKPLAYVRDKPKKHGQGKQIEGALVKDKKVIVIEDLITTGTSSLTAAKALKKEGVSKLEVYSIFSYGFLEAIKNYEQSSCNFSALSNFEILINLLTKTNFLTQKESEIALEWNKNPKDWKN